MLKNTFCHLVSEHKEAELWKNNLLNWDEIKEEHPLHSQVFASKKALEENNYHFFLNNLPKKQHWRTYKEFPYCFLDIETTGLSRDWHDVTVIGIYDGKESKILVKGKNLDQFPEEIKKYGLIITFNGKCFDVPFLKSKFPEADLNKLHVDLRYVLRELGYSGGLKRIEREFGLEREEEIKEVDGWEAVRLWHKYQKGDEEALRLLMKYNQADIENLKFLMDFAYEKMKEKHFFSQIS
ncbi:MAG: ribonuclease H-like domain-containing protein [Nanoarchaeota archaeon]